MLGFSDEEVDRARRAARRLWRLTTLAVLQFLGLGVIGLVLLYNSAYFSFLAWVLTVSFVCFKVTVFYFAWKAYREWRRLFEADLRDGLTTDKTAKVYDRFRSWSDPTTYVLWADAGGEGLELQVGRQEFKKIRPGDSIVVDYLPRSQLAVRVRKVS